MEKNFLCKTWVYPELLVWQKFGILVNHDMVKQVFESVHLCYHWALKQRFEVRKLRWQFKYYTELTLTNALKNPQNFKFLSNNSLE